MLKRKGLLFVVALLAVASLMAAMSFSSATVKAEAKVNIVDQSHGLLALGEGSAANYNGNKLVIDLTGKDGNAGLQPGAQYTWDKAFTLTNNSKETIKVTIPELTKNSGTLAKYADLELHDQNGASLEKGIVLTPGATANINLSVKIHDNVPKRGYDFTFDLYATNN